MIIPDVNLLLYATITGFPQHERSRVWWENVLNGSETVGLTSSAVFGYLRIATNGRVLTSPASVADALGQVRGWLAQSNVTFLRPGPRHLDICFGLLKTLGTAGDLTTDVQLAAHAIEEDAELHSHDMDFGRFPDLRWVDPLRDRRPRRRASER
ncbi:MAG: type II toxin-antitoxin system VapC family toxin [Chloroflexota bacterium]